MKPKKLKREEYLSLHSEHKEADHLIAYYAKYAKDRDENENKAIYIVLHDTDIYILLSSIAYYC